MMLNAQTFFSAQGHRARTIPPARKQASRIPLRCRHAVFAAGEVSLHLLRTPASVGLPHVGGRLDGRDELEDDVADADEADDGARDDAQHAVVEQDGAYEDVECATADEGEQEGGVARDLRRDLELEEAGGCRGASKLSATGLSERRRPPRGGGERELWGSSKDLPRPKIITYTPMMMDWLFSKC